MVKNTCGGSKAKSQARKFVMEPENEEQIRFSSCDLEVYAVVTKMYGNSRCLVHTQHGKDAQCVIRNKFKGRNKRFHMVNLGSIVLVGFRHWDTTFHTCDLLHVYSSSHVSTLMALPDNPLACLSTVLHNTPHDDLFSEDAPDDCFGGGWGSGSGSGGRDDRKPHAKRDVVASASASASAAAVMEDDNVSGFDKHGVEYEICIDDI